VVVAPGSVLVLVPGAAVVVAPFTVVVVVLGRCGVTEGGGVLVVSSPLVLGPLDGVDGGGVLLLDDDDDELLGDVLGVVSGVVGTVGTVVC
jgi:hypothetical protein